MQPVPRSESMPLVIDADDLQQIQAAVAFAAEQQLKRIIIHGGYDAPLCAELLKKHRGAGDRQRGLPAAAAPLASPTTPPTPCRRGCMRRACDFCIAGGGRFGASMLRNLPYHAAMAVAFGLPAEDVRSAGDHARPGRDPGRCRLAWARWPQARDATLIIADGDPLETATQVEAAFVQGRPGRSRRPPQAALEEVRREVSPARSQLELG
jgi:hypothetical protein